MDLSPLTSFSQLSINIVEFSLTILGPIDEGGAFCLGDGGESRTVELLSETSEARSDDEGESNVWTWDAILTVFEESGSCTKVGADDGVDEDSGRGANKVVVELNQSDSGKLEGTRTEDETSEAEDTETDGDDSWDIGEMMGRGTAGTVDEDDRLEDDCWERVRVEVDEVRDEEGVARSFRRLGGPIVLGVAFLPSRMSSLFCRTRAWATRILLILSVKSRSS